MKSSIVLSCLLVVGACASDSRRPAATAHTEPRHSHPKHVVASDAADAQHRHADHTQNDKIVDHDRRDIASVDRAAISDNTGKPVDSADHAEPIANDRRQVERSARAEPVDNRRDGVTAVAPAELQRADNTGINQRDVDRKTLTPLDQRENATDLDATQRIRKAVIADDSLSFTAKNAKIITAGGRVTLRGPVKSTAERAAIAAHASQVVGAAHVDNQLEIAK